MRINFFYKDTKEPVVLQDDFYIDMYGRVYEVEANPLDLIDRNSDVGWEILE
jgi:hypothetical protein